MLLSVNWINAEKESDEEKESEVNQVAPGQFTTMYVSWDFFLFLISALSASKINAFFLLSQILFWVKKIFSFHSYEL